MSREEARKLLGGYATGSLSESDRKALFEAALEDQDLFDELAGEQALKEVLDEPGARQRLISALEPPRQRAWLWVWAGAAATLAVAILVVMSQRTPAPPQQIAQVEVTKSPEPAIVRSSPPAAPKPAPLRTEAREKPLADKLDKIEEARGTLAAAAPQAAGPPAAVAMRAENMAAKAAPGFAFDYAIRGDGFLQVVPGTGGFLTVRANDAVIFPSGAVNAGTPLRIVIPADTTTLVITFSGMQGTTRSPLRRGELSGTVTDQDPPNQQIAIQLSLTPGTR